MASSAENDSFLIFIDHESCENVTLLFISKGVRVLTSCCNREQRPVRSSFHCCNWGSHSNSADTTVASFYRCMRSHDGLILLVSSTWLVSYHSRPQEKSNLQCSPTNQILHFILPVPTNTLLHKWRTGCLSFSALLSVCKPYGNALSVFSFPLHCRECLHAWIKFRNKVFWLMFKVSAHS